MMSTLLIHMWSNNVAKRSHLSRGTCLDHIWSKSAVWQRPPTRGICSDHIWLKSAAWQSPPTRGTFWATFGQSLLCVCVCVWPPVEGGYLLTQCQPQGELTPPNACDVILPPNSAHQPLPGEMLADGCPLGNVYGTATELPVGILPGMSLCDT